MTDPYRPAPAPAEFHFRDDEERVFWEACVIAMMHDQKQVFMYGATGAYPGGHPYPGVLLRDMPNYVMPDPVPTADGLVLARRKRML
jgi:hypothetical protein